MNFTMPVLIKEKPLVLSSSMQKTFLLSVTMNGYPVLYSFLPEYIFSLATVYDRILHYKDVWSYSAVFTLCSYNKYTELVYTAFLHMRKAAFHKLCVPKNKEARNYE